jgi:hypothetical protein
MEYPEGTTLNEQERQAPYARFFDRPQPPISAEQQRAAQGELSPEWQEGMPERALSELLHPEKIRTENGFCLLPNGGGYVAALHEMPNITLEMYKWWNCWRMEADCGARYKIWCPGKHYACYENYVAEDCGSGLEEIYFISSITGEPEKIGYTPQAMAAAGMLLADGGNAFSKLRSAPALSLPMAGVVIHFLYRGAAGGLCMRSRFWKGYQVRGGRLVPVLAPGQQETLVSRRGLFEHNCLEMAFLRTLLPPLWQEMGLMR